MNNQQKITIVNEEKNEALKDIAETVATEPENTSLSEETTATTAEIEIFSPYEVKFARPYTFEGKTYNSINLEGLETLTSKDMRDAESWLTKKGIVSATPEMSMEYACFVASRATSLPIEFFERLHPKNAIKVKNRVTNFFYGED